MGKIQYLNDSFYDQKSCFLDMLNSLFKNELVSFVETYHNNIFFLLYAKDCDKTREILSKVLNDIDLYISESKGFYTPTENESINLCELHSHYCHIFGVDDICIDIENKICYTL